MIAESSFNLASLDDPVPAWLPMWILALAIFVALKLLTWCEVGPRRFPWWRSVAYLLAWPGMDAASFLGQRERIVPTPGEWLFATFKLLIGVLLLFVAGQTPLEPDMRAWMGIVGLIFTLHFGVFHLLSCLWRTAGINAVPLMHWPIAAVSVGEFWSRRWNLAFRDLTHRYVFRPLMRRIGASCALWLGFLLSGLIHDLVISIPAGGGYGGPTVFFLLQAAAISLERSKAGKRMGLGRGLTGRLFTAVVLLAPLPLMVHSAFRTNVVLTQPWA